MRNINSIQDNVKNRNDYSTMGQRNSKSEDFNSYPEYISVVTR